MDRPPWSQVPFPGSAGSPEGMDPSMPTQEMPSVREGVRSGSWMENEPPNDLPYDASQDGPTELIQWDQQWNQQWDQPLQRQSYPNTPPIWQGNSGNLRGSGGYTGRASTSQPDRRSMIGLFAAIGIVIVLASVVGVIVLLQAFSLTSGSSTPQGRNPVSSLPTATATSLPTATATATPLPTNAATFVALDTTTQGNWQNSYGSQGAVVIGDTQNLPSAIQVTPSSQSDYTWAGSTSDQRALQKLSNASDRIASCWYSSSTFTIDVNITDGNTYRLALYLLDWDQQNRVETVSVLDPSGNVLDSHQVQNFASGQYLVWTVRGHVVLQITNGSGSINAVASGLFFASAS